MSHIIAGWFDTQASARGAMSALAQGGFTSSEFGSFYLAPPGQHGTFPVGGDAWNDEGTRASGPGALAAGAIGGAAGLAVGAAAAVAIPAIGPAGAVAGVGIGAYVGALVGALSSSRAGDQRHASTAQPVERPAGIMVAVCIDRPGTQARALELLRDQGALGIEEAQGRWRDREWLDFDPRRPPRLVSGRGTDNITARGQDDIAGAQRR